MFTEEDQGYHDERVPMALHDYRRLIDIHGGGYIAIEVTTENTISLEGALPGAIDVHTAGLVLDALAGAIKTVEGLTTTTRPDSTRPGASA